MNIDSTLPTSRRGYLSQNELKQFANITINDVDEADDQISQAEEIIDSFIRRAEKFIKITSRGLATSGAKGYLIDDSGDTPLHYGDNYWIGCEVEILGGTNAGERRKITAYDKTLHKITVDSEFTSAIDATSMYVIYQLGLFPRYCDVLQLGNTYYKRIPEAIKRAVAAQVEYIIEKGESFFKGAADLKSESIDDYSYTRGEGATGENALIAPKARQFLRGFISRIGNLRAGNPTNL